jgi:hypothetical protein
MKNTSVDYKGCHIVLTHTQQADGTWGCNTQSLHSDRIAGALKANRRDLSVSRGAELAALQKPNTVIDL